MSDVTYGAVYFVTDGEAIKIGFATNVARRMKELQTNHYFPLFLLGSIPSNRSEERIIHKRFERIRLKGEWFRTDDEIFRFIDGFEERGELIPGDQIENWQAKFPAGT